LARFDALAGGGEAETPRDPFANAASRTDSTLFRCFNARDWAGVLACVAPELVFDERRRMVRNTCGREVWLAQFRFLFDVPASRFTTQLFATRGELLSLNLHCFEGEVADGGGPLAMDDHFALHEVDGEGRIVAIVLFDLEDREAATAELDRRYDAGEGAARAMHGVFVRTFSGAVASRDWEPVLALCAPAFVEYDHRALAVLGTTRSAEAWVQNFRTLVDLAPDTVYRVDHFRSGARGFCSVGTWHGSREGGGYEIPLFAVIELDEQDRMARADIYDLDQLDQAHARFEELNPSVPPLGNGRIEEGSSPWRFANAATATVDPVIACMIAHDWQGFEQLFAEDFRMSDRRRVVQLELDRDGYVAFTREVADGRTIRADSQVVATRGDRLALTRPAFEFADADVGPSEIAFLILTEVNDRGRIVAYVRFDLEDLDAAYAELEARWAAGEAAAHPVASKWLADYLRYFAACDWNAMTALFASELVGENHRLVGWGSLRGAAAVVSTLQAQIQLAPDTQERVDHVRTCAHAVLFEYAWHGTREGGAFENVWIVLVALDALGRARRVDVWEAEQLELARARFDELRPDPLRIPPNAATRANDRQLALAAAGEWEAVQALHPPGFVFDDRRRGLRTGADGDSYLASLRWALPGTQVTRTVLATAGDRLALQRNRFTRTKEILLFEIETLALTEIDGDGRIVAIVLFDPDDRAAASAELFERYARNGADEMPAAWFEFVRAWNDHDLGRLRTLLPSDYFFHDHRRTGIGRVEGEGYIASLAALYALSPDVRLEPLYWVAGAAHGRVGVMRWVGTNAEGGEFEAVFAGLSLYQGEVPVGAELFEIADLDAALARLEELCAGRTT
jgi:hypothetical protein